MITWDHKIVPEFLVFNTWNDITVCKQIIVIIIT